jgi:uncharacterized protein YyaL (SSP411 family)
LDGAGSAARFLLDNLRAEDGRLLHCWRNGTARHNAYLEDYAGLADALVTLYETLFEEHWIEEAVGLVDQILDRFTDPEQGGFFFASSDHETLIARKKDMLDSSVPSGGGKAVTALLRLGKLCGRSDYLRAAETALGASSALIGRAPMGVGQLLLGLDMLLGPTPEVVVLGGKSCPDTEAVLAQLHRSFVPNKVVACRDDNDPQGDASQALAGAFAGKQPIPPGPTVFVCENFTCKAPVSGKEAAVAAIDALAGQLQSG